MVNVVGGISMSHAPGMTGWPDAPPDEVKERMSTAYRKLSDYLESLRPDLILAVLDDHFENHSRQLMPTFAIGVGESHKGPAQHFLGLLQLTEALEVPSNLPLARFLLERLVHSGFDIARMEALEYGNNLMVPLKLIRPACDIPVLPFYINVFSPPLATPARCYQLGRTIRNALDQWEEPLRVVVLATGGLSHWPPLWMEDSPKGIGILERMKKFQTHGRSVLEEDPDLFLDIGAYEIELAEEARTQGRQIVNPDWDRKVLDALVADDKAFINDLTHQSIEQGGGNGGQEVRNWIAAHGILNDAKARVIDYVAVQEWICGIGFMVYETEDSPPT